MALCWKAHRKLLQLTDYSPCSAVVYPDSLYGDICHWVKEESAVTHKEAGAVPPHVAALGKEGVLDDLRGHPSVGPRCTHLGGLVPLSGQTEVCDLQGFAAQVVPLHRLQDED